MKILLFDPFNGIAGDMIIGALIAAGADSEAVRSAMSSVVAEPVFKPVVKHGISAVKVETNAERTHRNLDEVIEIVLRSSASKEVKDMAVRVFHRINAGETAVHGTVTHFHEVGADDAIADVIGACTAFLSINPDTVSVRPINLGCGYIRGEHGTMPVPAPATVEILKKSGLATFTDTDNETGELCTPTGAALISEFVEYRNGAVSETGAEDSCGSNPSQSHHHSQSQSQSQYQSHPHCHSPSPSPMPQVMPHGKIIASGYGAGTKDLPRSANVLRAMILESDSREENFVDILETNVDDVTGEVLSYTMQRILDAGARDVSAAPILMKKGRSGFLVKVICVPGTADKFVKILSEELGTLGIRHIKAVHRSILHRTFEEVKLVINDETYLINVKIGWIDDAPATYKAEFEDVKKCALKTGMPMKNIAAMAENLALEQIQ
ncbi:MAG: LarC family nickel insertion protein [Methanomicrobium sp.]|nr:LarC family nickel insertion protein [Methanomicrobium sp.]